MHQHTQPAKASTRPTNEEYEDSSVSTATEAEKEIIAENALNEGATQPFKDQIAEERQQHSDGGDIEKQTTTRSIRSGKAVSVNNVAAIPNGGTKAWLQVLGAWVLFFNSWGIINTFGAYQTYYETGILSSSSPS
ncbi:hypothetical protein KCU94_g4191, partial [Aureobasidium melanogenum]